jgi:hypothetical protein
MACSCTKKRNTEYVWTKGESTVVYPTEIQAKAAVRRKGGSYETKQKG